MRLRQQGVAIIEMLIIIPLLLIILVGVIDVVGYMQNYLISNGLAREIARIASSTAELPEGRFQYEGYSNEADGLIQIIFSRGDFMALAQEIEGYSMSLSVANRNVEVTVTIPYQTLFLNEILGLVWNNPAVSARATFPILMDS